MRFPLASQPYKQGFLILKNLTMSGEQKGESLFRKGVEKATLVRDIADAETIHQA